MDRRSGGAVLGPFASVHNQSDRRMVDMIVRFRTTGDAGMHIAEAEYVEVEGIKEGTIHNGKWTFKDYPKEDQNASEND